MKSAINKKVDGFTFEPSAKSGRVRWYWGFALLLAGVILVLCCLSWGARQQSANVVRLSGRIEGDETHIGPLTSGRVEMVAVHEGDRVRKGQLLIVIASDAERSGRHFAEQGLALANSQIDRVEGQIRRPSARHGNKVARVLLAPVRLLGRGVASLNPASAVKRQAAVVQTSSLSLLLAQANSQLLMAEAERDKAQAVLDQVKIKIANCKIYCPTDGICTASNVAPGDIVGPGQVLMGIMDPDKVYMRGFIPEGEIGRVKVGQMAKVYLDSLPHSPFVAHVSAIDERSSFTPENIYFREDRVKQVFGVKLSIENPAGLAKAGMPADAEIVI
jgi:multidrug resistance efflux pump